MKEFRKTARGSGYEEIPLVEEFKRRISAIIHWRLIKSEWQPSSIKQWYDWAIALNQDWRENRREEERLRDI